MSLGLIALAVWCWLGWLPWILARKLGSVVSVEKGPTFPMAPIGFQVVPVSRKVSGAVQGELGGDALCNRHGFEDHRLDDLREQPREAGALQLLWCEVSLRSLLELRCNLLVLELRKRRKGPLVGVHLGLQRCSETIVYGSAVGVGFLGPRLLGLDGRDLGFEVHQCRRMLLFCLGDGSQVVAKKGLQPSCCCGSRTCGRVGAHGFLFEDFVLEKGYSLFRMGDLLQKQVLSSCCLTLVP